LGKTSWEEGEITSSMKSNSIKKGSKNLWLNSLKDEEDDESPTPTKDERRSLRKINMFRRKVYSHSFFY